MTKLLRLPAIVFLLTAAACDTPAHTTEAQQAALEQLPPCTASNLGATACVAGAPSAMLECQLLPVNLDSGIPPSPEDWEFVNCAAPTRCIDASTGGFPQATCAVCSPGTSSCDNGNLTVCNYNGSAWLPAGSCRANACQCGGKYPHCSVCN